jgi:hypothetical protein
MQNVKLSSCVALRNYSTARRGINVLWGIGQQVLNPPVNWQGSFGEVVRGSQAKALIYHGHILKR